MLRNALLVVQPGKTLKYKSRKETFSDVLYVEEIFLLYSTKAEKRGILLCTLLVGDGTKVPRNSTMTRATNRTAGRLAS